MPKSLEEIRNKLRALENRKSGPMDKTVYAHWMIPEGTSSIQRFLPDGNNENTLFWTERQLLKFPFPGIKGHDESKPVIVQVPCIEMFPGEKGNCPVLNEVRPWWRDESLKPTASKYWVKRTYYMQGFVLKDPMNETDAPENPIRKFIIGPQIFAIIHAALLDPDMTNNPVDYINGTSFIISKTSKGGFSDYGTSKWQRNETALTPEMQEAIKKYSLVDLSSYLPKKPTPEQLAVIYDMFQASLDGELYDPEKWSQHYKPFGFDAAENTESEGGEGRKPSRPTATPRAPVVPSTPIVVSLPETEVDESADDTPKEEVKTPAKGSSPQEILQMLRQRNM